MKNIQFLVLFISITSSSIFSQIISEKDIKIYEEADILMEKGQFSEALPIYLRLVKKDSINPDLNYLIGVCYVHSNTQKAKAIKYLEQAIACIEKCTLKDDKLHEMAFLYLGDAYHSNYQFDLAIDTYEHFKMLLSPAKDRKLIAEANRKIETCKIAKQLMFKPIDVKIENMGSTINSQFAEYSPVLTADEATMIFTTRRPESTGRILDKTGETYEDIYISHKIDSVWSTAESIGKLPSFELSSV
jgi:tetratricopeptide (TPR) repeat protein